MRYKYIILLILSIALSNSIWAQKSCLNTLREAKELYEEGLIDEIPELLSGCMESGFTRAQRIEAYKLIILAYLFDDDQFAAEKTMDEFLKKFPEYEVMPDDPVEFVYLLESYKTSSVYTLNFTLGPTFSNQRIFEPYTATDMNVTDITTKTGAGFFINLGMSRNIGRSFFINIDLNYSFNNYSIEFLSSTNLRNGEQLNQTEISAKEKLTKADLPISFSYSLRSGNMNYVVRLGGMVSYVSGVTLLPYRSHDPDIDVRSSSNIDISQNREQIYYAALAGLGFEYKVPRGFLVLDIRYHFGFPNMVIEANRHNNPELLSDYLYIDSNFALDYFSIGIGYHFSMYQSKKNRY
jgi:hypothetical protein